MYTNSVIVMLFFEAKVYKIKSCTQIYIWTAPLFACTNSTYVVVWLFGSEMGNDLAVFLVSGSQPNLSSSESYPKLCSNVSSCDVGRICDFFSVRTRQGINSTPCVIIIVTVSVASIAHFARHQDN